MEEFKQCVPVDIKTYLEEQKVSDVYKAATLADDYKLTHHSSGIHKDLKSRVMSKVLVSSGGDNFFLFYFINALQHKYWRSVGLLVLQPVKDVK